MHSKNLTTEEYNFARERLARMLAHEDSSPNGGSPRGWGLFNCYLARPGGGAWDVERCDEANLFACDLVARHQVLSLLCSGSVDYDGESGEAGLLRFLRLDGCDPGVLIELLGRPCEVGRTASGDLLEGRLADGHKPSGRTLPPECLHIHEDDGPEIGAHTVEGAIIDLLSALRALTSSEVPDPKQFEALSKRAELARYSAELDGDTDAEMFWDAFTSFAGAAWEAL